MSDFEDSSNEAAAADQKPAGYAKRFLRAIVESERKKVHKTLGLEPVHAKKSTMSDFGDSSNEEPATDQKPAGYGTRFWRWISAGERKKVQRILGLDQLML